MESTFALKEWDLLFKPITSEEESGLNKWVDFAHVMALEKTKILCGKGFILTTEDEELKAFFDELNENSHLFEEVQELCYNVFRYGVATIGFDRLLDGTFRLYVPSRERKVLLAKSYKHIIGASIYKVVHSVDGRKGMVWERWNNERVERSYFFDRTRVPFEGLSAKIPPNDILPESEQNPFGGVIPFQDVQNYTFSDKPDSYAARGLIDVFNQQMDHYVSEIEKNKTRILFYIPEQLKKNAKADKNIKLDYMISTQDESTKVTHVPSTLLWQGIEAALDSMVKRIYAFSAAAFNANLTGGGRDTTATELGLNNSSQSNSVICSRKSVNSKLTIFFKKLIMAKFGRDIEFSWSLNENTAISEADLLDQIKEKVMMGLMSKVDAIAAIDNIDVEEAEKKLEEINKEFDEAAEKAAALGEEPNNQPNNESKKSPN